MTMPQETSPQIGLPDRRLGLLRSLGASRDTIGTVVVVLVIAAVAQIVSGHVPAYIMPEPLVVIGAIGTLLTESYVDIAVTMARLLAAMLCSMLIGSAIGMVMGLFESVRPFLRSLIVIDTGIPALSWMLIAVFWFKDPETRIFFILTVILLPFYALTVYEGVRALSKDLVEMVDTFQPTKWQVLRKLILPHTVAYVLIATKSAVGYATRMVVFAELIGSAVGIGAQMNMAQSNFQIDRILGWTCLLVILNLLMQASVDVIDRRLLKWRPEATVR